MVTLILARDLSFDDSLIILKIKRIVNMIEFWNERINLGGKFILDLFFLSKDSTYNCVSMNRWHEWGQNFID